MGEIVLRLAILTGVIGGVIMVLAEGVALHHKLPGYLAHLRRLNTAKKFFRLYSEIGGIVFVALIQPVIITLLVLSALDSFNPDFSEHVMAQIRLGIHSGTPK